MFGPNYCENPSRLEHPGPPLSHNTTSSLAGLLNEVTNKQCTLMRGFCCNSKYPLNIQNLPVKFIQPSNYWTRSFSAQGLQDWANARMRASRRMGLKVSAVAIVTLICESMNIISIKSTSEGSLRRQQYETVIKYKKQATWAIKQQIGYQGKEQNIKHIQLPQNSNFVVRQANVKFSQQISKLMDIRDFEGLTKFKVVIPLLYIISWVCMFVGPSFFPVIYQKLSIGLLIYLVYKIMWVFITIVIVLVKSWPLITRAKDQHQSNNYSSLTDITEQINYGFIIPSYKEEIELLSQTLEVLAAHKRAKSHYMVFLAMEAHEQGSDKKAQQLIQAFKGYFRVIDFTRHEIRPNEQKGKASNVSWCAQHLHLFFQKYMIDPNTVMLTILDADSWAPNVYFDVLEEKILQQYQKRHQRVYQPIQIFTRNHLQVPIFTRVYDILHSFAHMSNLWSCFDLTYPLSNYSISYNLVKRIGFWDTCADAIGQDFHTTIKALWKTKMEIKGRPIYVPFNQVNICTGNGYCADVKARFWQAERHAKGVADVAYCFKQVLTQRFKWKNLLVFWFVFETFAVTAVFPWILISMNYQNKILYRFDKASPELFSENSVSYLFTAMSIFGTSGYVLYEIIKRRANRIIYKQQNQSLLRLLEYPILFMFIFFTMSVPSFIIASFSTLFGNQQYIVAQKKNTKKQPHQI